MVEMEALVKTDASLRELLVPFNTTQRQYICLGLAGFSLQESAAMMNRRVHTIDHYLVEPNFRETSEFILANKDKYKNEAMTLWAEQLSTKSKLLLESLIELALEEVSKGLKGDRPLMKLGKECAGLMVRGSAGGVPSVLVDTDELILRRHTKHASQ